MPGTTVLSPRMPCAPASFVPSTGAYFPPMISARGLAANGRRVLFVAGDKRDGARGLATEPTTRMSVNVTDRGGVVLATFDSSVYVRRSV